MHEFDRVMTDLFNDTGFGCLVNKEYCVQCEYNFDNNSDHTEDHNIIMMTPMSWYYDDYILQHTSFVGEIDFMDLNDYWYVEKHFYYECMYCQNSPEDCRHFDKYDKDHNVPIHKRCP